MNSGCFNIIRTSAPKGKKVHDETGTGKKEKQKIYVYIKMLLRIHPSSVQIYTIYVQDIMLLIKFQNYLQINIKI